jgi:hypothetical protein
VLTSLLEDLDVIALLDRTVPPYRRYEVDRLARAIERVDARFDAMFAEADYLDALADADGDDVETPGASDSEPILENSGQSIAPGSPTTHRGAGPGAQVSPV